MCGLVVSFNFFFFFTYIAESFPRAAPVEALGFSAGTFTVAVPAAVLPWLELSESLRHFLPLPEVLAEIAVIFSV